MAIVTNSGNWHTLVSLLLPFRMLGSMQNRLWQWSATCQPSLFLSSNLPSIDTCFPSMVTISITPFNSSQQPVRLTNGQLHLGLPPARRRKSSRGIAGLAGGPQSRTCQGLPQHRGLSSCEQKGKKTTLYRCRGGTIGLCLDRREATGARS